MCANLFITNEEKNAILEIVNKRWSNNYNDGQGVAYMLDPRFLGKDMDIDTYNSVEEFILNWHLPNVNNENSMTLQYETFKRRCTTTEDALYLKLLEIQKGTLTVQ